MIARKSLVVTLLFALLALISLSACDQVRERVASLIGSKSAEETLVSVRSNMASGKFKEVKAEAELHANKPGDRQAEFAFVTAQACVKLGEVSQALDYLAIALKAGLVSSAALMVDPSFESIRTDIRFVTLLTIQSSTAVSGSATVSATTTTQAASAASAAEPAAVIRMDGQGIEVKAGSTSIKLPN